MTDVVGMRDDARVDGTVGKSAVQQQLGSLVTNKLPLLSGPGAVLENALYYDITSSTVTAVELQETFQKDRIDFNNPRFGASPTCYIPSVLFANTVFVNMTLPSQTWGSDVSDAYFHAPHGWGFSAINSIILYMGASSVAQIQMSGDSNFLIMMATCETVSKREALLDKAGRYLNTQDPSSIMGAPVANKPIFRRRRYGDFGTPIYSQDINNGSVGRNTDLDSADLRNAMVPIRLPFSSMIAIEKRISLDTKLLTQPLQITLGLRNAGEIFDTNLPDTTFQNLSSLTCQLWQQELSDKSMSVRQELLRQPEFNVGYPFQYVQSYDISVPTVSASVNRSAFDGTQDTRMNLSALINSDLTTMLFYVRNNNASGRRNEGTSANNANITTMNFKNGAWAYGERLDNMELKLNGQRFYAFDSDNYSQATLAKQIDHPNVPVYKPILYTASSGASVAATEKQFIGSTKNGVTNQWAYPSRKVNSNFYELNFGKLRSITSEAHMQNTGRFTNQTFQISFTINRDVNETTSIPDAQLQNYRFYMSYLYNAVFLIGGDGGTTKLITN